MTGDDLEARGQWADAPLARLGVLLQAEGAAPVREQERAAEEAVAVAGARELFPGYSFGSRPLAGRRQSMA